MALKNKPANKRDWNNILKDLPYDVLTKEQRRRLALEKNVTKIPDRLLNAEIDKRRSVPFTPLD